MPERSSLLGAIACYLFLGALLLAPSLFGNKRLTSIDALGQFEPWASAMPPDYAPANPLLLDQSIAFLPWMDFAAEELRRGELPLWNPYNFCGHPFVGTYQSALYWPINWIHYAFPSWRTHAWTALLRLVLAGTFTYLFLRALALRPPAAALGGLGFMLSGFLVAWLNHPHANAALLLPAIWWSIERVARRPGARTAALFGLFVGLELLAGHVQTALHVALVSAAYAALRLVVPAGGIRLAPRGFAWLVVGGALGGLLALPQILPFLEYLGASQAGVVFEELDTVERPGILHTAVLLLFPDALGGPHTGDYAGPLGPNLNFNELIGGYVGKVILAAAALALVAAIRDRRRRAPILLFTGLLVVCGLVAYQVFPFYDALRLVPKLRSTKLLRFSLFVAFGLATLGAYGLDAILARLRPARRPAFAALAFVLAAGELLVFAHDYNPQIDPERILPPTAVTDFLAKQSPTDRVLGIDNATFAPNANLFDRVPMIGGYDSIEYRRLTELCLRMTNTPPAYPFITKIGLFDRLEALPLLSFLGVRFLLTKEPIPASAARELELRRAEELYVYENTAALPRAFLARDVELVLNADERIERMTGAAFDPWTALLEADSPAFQRFQRSAPTGNAGDDAVLLARYEPRTIEAHVRTPTESLLVLADSWAPGWTASAEPDPGPGPHAATAAIELAVERVNHHFRGVWIPPGQWIVRFRYDPGSTRLGLWLAAGALLALALLARAAPAPEAPENSAA